MSYFLLVICLSDDEDDDQNISKSIIASVEQQPSNVHTNGEKKQKISDWIIHRKDVIRIPDLTIKPSDLTKKPLELPCSTVRFGIVEFNVEEETVFLRETDFELKLKSNRFNQTLTNRNVFFSSENLIQVLS